MLEDFIKHSAMLKTMDKKKGISLLREYQAYLHHESRRPKIKFRGKLLKVINEDLIKVLKKEMKPSEVQEEYDLSRTHYYRLMDNLSNDIHLDYFRVFYKFVETLPKEAQKKLNELNSTVIEEINKGASQEANVMILEATKRMSELLKGDN